MSIQAYVIGQNYPEKASFSDIETILKSNNITLNSPIEHALVDNTFYSRDLFYSGGWYKTHLYPRISENDPDRGYIQEHKCVQRRRTIIETCSHDSKCDWSTIGNLAGYSMKDDRRAKLQRMVEIYRERFQQPYFAITSPESVGKVASAFENFGLEVKLIEIESHSPHKYELLAPQEPTVNYLLRRRPKVNREKLTINEGKLAELAKEGLPILQIANRLNVPYINLYNFMRSSNLYHNYRKSSSFRYRS